MRPSASKRTVTSEFAISRTDARSDSSFCTAFATETLQAGASIVALLAGLKTTRSLFAPPTVWAARESPASRSAVNCVIAPLIALRASS